MAAAASAQRVSPVVKRATRVLLVDDEKRVLKVWQRVLVDAFFDVRVASSLADARPEIQAEGLDVVILDNILGDGRGTELLDDIERLVPRPRVAMVSGYLDGDLVVELATRCEAMVPKPLSAQSILQLVRRLAVDKVANDADLPFCFHHRLSHRELQVVCLASRGHSNKIVAAELGCSVATIKSYWKRVFAKTGRKTRTDVTAAMIRPHRPGRASACSGCQHYDRAPTSSQLGLPLL